MRHPDDDPISAARGILLATVIGSLALVVIVAAIAWWLSP